jgi:hypothetical protein
VGEFRDTGEIDLSRQWVCRQNGSWRHLSLWFPFVCNNEGANLGLRNGGPSAGSTAAVSACVAPRCQKSRPESLPIASIPDVSRFLFPFSVPRLPFRFSSSSSSHLDATNSPTVGASLAKD